MGLVARIKALTQALKRSDNHWLRHLVAVLLIIGGLLGFLPVLGFWMLPLGLSLLAVDFPWVRRLVRRSYVAFGRTIQAIKKRLRQGGRADG